MKNEARPAAKVSGRGYIPTPLPTQRPFIPKGYVWLADEIERLKDSGRDDESLGQFRAELQCNDVPLFEMTELGSTLQSDGGYLYQEKNWQDACRGWRRRPWRADRGPVPLFVNEASVSAETASDCSPSAPLRQIDVIG